MQTAVVKRVEEFQSETWLCCLCSLLGQNFHRAKIRERARTAPERDTYLTNLTLKMLLPEYASNKRLVKLVLPHSELRFHPLCKY
jgi:hypothetical protein